MQQSSDIVWVIALVMVTVPAFIVSAAFAYRLRNTLDRIPRSAIWLMVPLGSLLGAYVAFALVDDRFRISAVTMAGMGIWLIAVVNSIANIARSRQSAERIAIRQQLAAAREFFRRELRKGNPELRDEWFPYLIAFGLGPHIDKWFRSFGGAIDSSSSFSHATSSAGSYSSSSSGSSGWTGFGGGGGFAGAGASAAFATAVGGMAASVSAPSSSSSGGSSGGGGGSSGGGGGGGW
jgi:uncharacterized membrane protein YgcG